MIADKKFELTASNLQALLIETAKAAWEESGEGHNAEYNSLTADKFEEKMQYCALVGLVNFVANKCGTVFNFSKEE